MLNRCARFVLPALVVILASAAVWLVVGSITARIFAESLIKRVPVSIIKKELYYNYPAGDLAYTLQSKWEIRSDGSTVEFKPRFPPPPNLSLPPMRIIIDVQARTRTIVDDVTQSKTTYKLGTSVAGLTTIADNCGGQPGDAISPILSFQVVKVGKVSGDTEPRSTEVLRSPALGCAELKRVVFKLASSSRAVLIRSSEAILVTSGDPDAGDFAIPSSYVERAPSESMRQLRSRYPDVFPPIPPNAFAIEDAAYRQINQ